MAAAMASTVMRYCRATLPAGLKKTGQTRLMTQDSVLPGILAKHKAPSGKHAFLVVSTGHVQFEWEDTHEVLDADPGHPIVIEPDRLHHVKVVGPVEFHVEFYKKADEEAP
jgi:tellurite resistance-related uncharacterized protein